MTGVQVQVLACWPNSLQFLNPSGQQCVRQRPAVYPNRGAMKAFFGDRGTPGDLRATIADIGMQADLATAELRTQAGGVLKGDSAFPERIGTTALSMKLIFDIHRTISDWARWARDHRRRQRCHQFSRDRTPNNANPGIDRSSNAQQAVGTEISTLPFSRPSRPLGRHGKMALATD